jgi:hypothetical protein
MPTRPSCGAEEGVRMPPPAELDAGAETAALVAEPAALTQTDDVRLDVFSPRAAARVQADGMAAVAIDGIVVADNFLPAALFAGALTEFQQHMREHESSPARLETVVQLAVPRELERGLREYAAGGASVDWKTSADDDDGGLIELSGQAQFGDHPDHADVMGCGGPVDGRVCLLYLSGQGALVFTDVSTGQERRVEILPNRAVSWPNAQHTHRVEAALGHADEPRLMIGPHFSDTSVGGQLVRCGAKAFMDPTLGLFNGVNRSPTQGQQKLIETPCLKGLLKMMFFGCVVCLCVVGGIIVLLVAAKNDGF